MSASTLGVRVVRAKQIGRIVPGVHVAQLALALVQLRVEERGVAVGARRPVQVAVHLRRKLGE